MTQNKEKIYRLCKKYKINNYTINDDGSIDVDGDVYLSLSSLHILPLRFNKVSGYFDCSCNILTSLEGSPREVGDGFYCYRNNLISLKGCPKVVGGYFNCSENDLTSLIGSPEVLNSTFDCNKNNLTSLDGLPKELNGNIYFSTNNLHPFYERVYGEIGNKLSIFVKYMDYYEVFKPAHRPTLKPIFKKQNGLYLISDIKDGLL